MNSNAVGSQDMCWCKAVKPTFLQASSPLPPVRQQRSELHQWSGGASVFRCREPVSCRTGYGLEEQGRWLNEWTTNEPCTQIGTIKTWKWHSQIIAFKLSTANESIILAETQRVLELAFWWSVRSKRLQSQRGVSQNRRTNPVAIVAQGRSTSINSAPESFESASQLRCVPWIWKAGRL